MARKKLARFEENAQFSHVLEPSRQEIIDGWEVKGNWRENVFKNDRPIVLELGCGKGEYTVAMAQKYPEHNFVGIDVKGARIWYGAKEVDDMQMTNAVFLRTQIELIDQCFAAGEVDEIWITFPDPQIKFARVKHRLTHPDFLARYRQILKPGGVVHLKTDSEFLHGYTHGTLQIMDVSILQCFYDIDLQLAHEKEHILHTVKTHYEQMFRQKGKTITYLKFRFGK